MNEDELIKQAQVGDDEARNKLLEKYHFIINRVLFRFRNIKVDDSAKRYGAIMGILGAVKGYDFRGNFVGYAYSCAVRRAEREMGKENLIKIPNYVLHEILKEYRESNEDNWPFKMVEFQEVFTEIYNNLICQDDILENEKRTLFEESIKELKPIEADALKQRYGFTNDTLKTLGEKYNLSYERVRQVGEQSLLKLKHVIQRKIKHIKELK